MVICDIDQAAPACVLLYYCPLVEVHFGEGRVDTSIFGAHSIRGAASSTAHNMGVTISDILNAADWSSDSVFQKFYYKPSRDPSFGKAVLLAKK